MALATHMSQCDGEMALSEKKILLNLYKAIHVTKQEQAFLLKKRSLDLMLGEILTEEVRGEMLNVLLLVAAADGTIDPNELNFIEKVMRRLDMRKSDYIYFNEDGKIDVPKLQRDIAAIIENVSLLAN